MKKIPTLFKRDFSRDCPAMDEVTPGCEWVIEGEGVATVKTDGTCCRIKDGVLWKRYTVKRGKAPPEGFDPSDDFDEVRKKQEGWIRVGDGPEDQWHREAMHPELEDGTYELVGPKIQGNPYHLFDRHSLWRHGETALPFFPRDYAGIRRYLGYTPIEGVVWHHEDGRMVKIKARDFGIKWPRE